MKTIRILRNTGANLPPFTEGQVVNVADNAAELLCGLGLAEVLKAVPDEPMRAIPENPSIVAAEAKLNEVKDRWMTGKGANETPDQSPPKSKRPPKTKPELKE